MHGQLVMVTGEAAVWETLPADAQRAVVVAIARLVARMLEADHDE